MTSDEDPLENAPVGETTRQQFEQTLEYFEPLYDEFGGLDRDFDAHVAGIEVVETEECTPEIRVQWEADVTKTLPYGWDSQQTPTPTTGAEGRLQAWKPVIVRAVVFLNSLAICGAIMNFVMQSLAGDLTVNGEPFVAPDPAFTWGLVGIVGILALIINWAISGGLPPRMKVSR